MTIPRRYEQVPTCLEAVNQWVCYRLPRKIPFDPRSGKTANSTDKSTWCSFKVAMEYVSTFDGIGFVFSADDPFVGIDLDGCRDPESGEIDVWAKFVIRKLESYAEVSPSGTGVKIWCKGESPFSSGRKFDKLTVAANIETSKGRAIEIYDRARYFCVTGKRVKGFNEVNDVSSETIRSVLEECGATESSTQQTVVPILHEGTKLASRARNYVAAMPHAIDGQGGDKITFRAAVSLVIGFGLSDDEAMEIMREYNLRCKPPWSERDLAHKVASARNRDDGSKYLLDARPNDVASNLNRYCNEHHDSPAVLSSLSDEVERHVDGLSTDTPVLLTLSIPSVDQSLGGGIEPGEMIIVAGRPSHGKSALGMQAIYSLAEQGKTCLVISEEMPKSSLAKRTIQFASDIPEQQWGSRVADIRGHASEMLSNKSPILLANDLRSAERAYELAQQAKWQHGAEAVLVDYAQLLTSKGNGRYEQVSNTSITLSKISRSLGLTLIVLCQCNRQIEGRKDIIPNMSDLRDSGQLEQDADVILFGVYPVRIDPSQAQDDYLISIAKNRNREIAAPLVHCKFEPARMRISSGLDEVEYFPDWS